LIWECDRLGLVALSKKNAIQNAKTKCDGALVRKPINWRIFSTISGGHNGNIDGYVLNAQAQFQCKVNLTALN
jgi:hypothetical protein